MKERDKSVVTIRRRYILSHPKKIRVPNCYNLFTADFYKSDGMHIVSVSI